MKRILSKLLCVMILFGFLLTPISNATFLDTEKSNANTFGAGCWSAPTIPNLITPPNNTNTAASSITYDWSDSTFVCPNQAVQYQLELNGVQYAWQSTSTLTVSSVTEGIYTWRVRARDSQGYTSEFSSMRKIAVDRTAPTVGLSIAGSYTKVVEEKITNGEFNSGLNGWTSSGDVTAMSADYISNPSTTITAPGGGNFVRLGNTTEPGKYAWENRLMQNINSGAKSLSLSYNFYSRDYPPFDDPGFSIKLNGQRIFGVNAATVNPSGSSDPQARGTGWQLFTYDLSGITTMDTNLAMYGGNTGDTGWQAWAYVDKITTYYVGAPASATYTLTGADSGSGIHHYEYRIDYGSWQTTSGNFSGGLLANHGNHTIEYKSVDNVGYASPIRTVKTTTDSQAPSVITTLGVSQTTNNSVTLSWKAPGNNGTSGRASKYDVRYGPMSSCASFTFDSATKVEQVTAPATYNTQETLVVSGLNPSTQYCFVIKSADEAPNWSYESNRVFAMTPSGSLINPGDIVINEINWAGSSVSVSDTWLELRNMTNRTLALDNITLKRYSSGTDYTMPIDFTGKSIAPNGYFLIAKTNDFGGPDSQLNVTPDIWDTDLIVNDANLRIGLFNAGSLLEYAWNTSTQKEGMLVPSQKFYSMERATVPGDGINPLNWYTCIDAQSTVDFFDAGALYERGTPRAANRSENEPIVNPTHEPELTAAFANNTVKFTLSNVMGYTTLTYLLTYTSDSGQQGIKGQRTLDHQQEITINDLFIGTCSEYSCTPHTGVSTIQIEATISGTITTSLHKMLDL